MLREAERSCLGRYLARLVETVGDDLEEVVLFGSVARGESWPRGMPIRSDLDLLVVTDAPLADDTATALRDATLPLFLECGRQIAPQFRTRRQLEDPKEDQTASFLANLEQDGIRIYERRDGC